MPDNRLLSPFLSYRDDPALFAATFAAAVTSIAALLLHLAGVIRMPYTLSFLTAPGMVLILCIQIWAGRSGRTVLVNRIRVGFAAGIVALVAYNATRWVCGWLFSLSVSPFYSIYVFGTLITGQPTGSPGALLAGILYHISNGITFAVMYTLVAGPARWWFGLAWGAILEIAMLVIYPSSNLLQPPSMTPFVAVSLMSHAVYGSALGVISERYSLDRRGAHDE
jgi:hypothetical protein